MATAATVSIGSTAQWTDSKRYLWLIGLVVPSLAFVAWGMHALTAWGVWWWTGPIVVLVIVPTIDLVAGLDRVNPPDDVIEALEKDRYYRWITYAFLPIQYVGFVAIMGLVVNADLSLVDRIGAAVTLGMIGGIGINTAHELGHKRESHERWLSRIALGPTFYGHFYIEHNRGHHVRVATPEDPASSRVGESLCGFLPRTVGGSVRNAWTMEKKRIARPKQHPFRASNDVLNAWVMSIVLWAALIAWVMSIVLWAALIAWLGLAVLPFSGDPGGGGRRPARGGQLPGALRDVASTHRRRQDRALRAGRPEPQLDSNNVATNVLLYHLQRHSDHHANPTRRYQTLRDFEESPTLPTGYAAMILIALLPPVWRRVMDHRVLAHFEGDISRANISPRKRAKVLAAYPPPVVVEHASPLDLVETPAASAREVLAARCPGCGYTYDVTTGEQREGFAAGTAWADIPDSWCCPDCGVREKVDFVAA